MKLITCDALVGQPRVPIPDYECTLDDLFGEMRRLRISRAVVRHRHCTEISPMHGNRTLIDDIKRTPDPDALIPAWALTPDGQPPEFNVSDTIRSMLTQGVKIAWIDPPAHTYSPLPWCSGDLYDALQQSRVPLLADYSLLGADTVNTICEAFPQLRLVLLGVPRLGRNRSIYPLLRRHLSLMVCFVPTLSVFEGYKDLCDTFGPDRWVLGTGYPQTEGGSGIAGLMYAGLNDNAVEAVAHGTIERLLEEVRSHV